MIQRRKTARATGRRAARMRPNRIFELMQERGWTYADVAERVVPPVTDQTIMRIANGQTGLGKDWIDRLAKAFDVDRSELITAPAAKGQRRVSVTVALQAGAWAEQHEWPRDQQYDVMIPDDPAFRGLTLYAGEIRGQSMNLRFPDRSIVVLSRLMQRPNEIVEGKQYHVRVKRTDGTTEETIKTLVQDREGRYWLKPESDAPEHQEWIPLEGRPGETVELIGRVRFVFWRED